MPRSKAKAVKAQVRLLPNHQKEEDDDIVTTPTMEKQEKLRSGMTDMERSIVPSRKAKKRQRKCVIKSTSSKNGSIVDCLSDTEFSAKDCCRDDDYSQDGLSFKDGKKRGRKRQSKILRNAPSSNTTATATTRATSDDAGGAGRSSGACRSLSKDLLKRTKEEVEEEAQCEDDDIPAFVTRDWRKNGAVDY